MDEQNNHDTARYDEPLSLRVASIDVESVTLTKVDVGYHCNLQIRRKDGEQESFEATARDELSTVADLVTQLCIRPIFIIDLRVENSESVPAHETKHYITIVEERSAHRPDPRAGFSRFASDSRTLGIVVSTIRAASHAGLLKPAYRANNQKFLRALANEMVEQQLAVLSSTRADPSAIDRRAQLEAEAIALRHLNQAASAAIVTATNHPKADSILSLFDTSAWLFDHRGERRDAYTETNLWLAWYPGLRNEAATIGDVIDTMPVAPDIKIPWIVRMFENPKGWLRFRGSVDLEDHDVLHVLLGRGLQDQDEAFVVGFAMGTAKKTSRIQFQILKFALTYLYPEPYRVPKYLQPAFHLGFECGRETGIQDLYRQSLKDLRTTAIGQAREKLKIDVKVLQKYYELEQQEIPFTIASLRLP